MQEVYRAVQNAHRMHPDLVSAELVAGARELAELSGAMHGDAPGYGPSDGPEGATLGLEAKRDGGEDHKKTASMSNDNKDLGLDAIKAPHGPTGK